MAFQPVVDAEAQSIHAYEALVRGPNGEGAARVIPAPEDPTYYAFDQACRVKAIELAARLGMTRRLNINFLPNAVYDPEACLSLTLEASEAHGFPPERITFEFTENEEMMDTDHVSSIVSTYESHRFRTAIDDFGAGYAGLSLLASFQTDYIKLDRTLIADIDDSGPRVAIVDGILNTAGQLGIEVVAEGVERVEEYRVLRSMGLRYFQGYLFARPALERLAGESDIVWPAENTDADADGWMTGGGTARSFRSS